VFRAIAAGLAAASALALASCGSEEPPNVQGPARAVAATIDALEKATARGDFVTICDRLFTAAERKQAGASDCPSLLRRTAGDVRRPRIRIESIRLRGNQAIASVTTTAEGQRPVRESIVLIRKHGAYRIASLAGHGGD
jgi:hypothetical protein